MTEPPSRVEFTNVNGGRVDCTVRGNPLPTVDWLAADGGSITNILGIRHVLGNGTIHFPAFEAEAFRQDVHWAIYKCSAVNSVGAVVSRDVTVRAGMSCHGEGAKLAGLVICGPLPCIILVAPRYRPYRDVGRGDGHHFRERRVRVSVRGQAHAHGSTDFDLLFWSVPDDRREISFSRARLHIVLVRNRQAK